MNLARGCKGRWMEMDLEMNGKDGELTSKKKRKGQKWTKKRVQLGMGIDGNSTRRRERTRETEKVRDIER